MDIATLVYWFAIVDFVLVGVIMLWLWWKVVDEDDDE